MRSRNSRIPVAVLAVLLLAPAAAAPFSLPVDGQASTPTQMQIARALEQVKADPNLAAERTIKTLEWEESKRQTHSGIPSWLAWIVGLFRWAGESARYLIWVAAVLLAGMLGVYIFRALRGAELPRRGERLVIPTHVRDLDIRPESLPADIGGAARGLWDEGRRREALGLLYRGLLSRLAHIYRVPIRESSTEGECLALAAGRLTPHRQDYAGRLVLVWQRVVYGSEQVEPAIVYALCRDFTSLLDHPSSGPLASRRAS